MTTTSADPANLAAFLEGAAPLTGRLEAGASAAASAYRAFAAGGSAQSGSLGGLASLFPFLEDLRQNEAFLAAVNQAVVAADAPGRPGAVSVSDASIAARLAGEKVGRSPGQLEIAPSTLLGAPRTSGFSDDPVNTCTGNFFQHEVDLAFPGHSRVLDLARAYNSLAAERIGAFGAGWSCLLDMSVVGRGGERATVRLVDGAEVVFLAGGGGAFFPDGRPGLSLTQSDDGSWDLRADPRTHYRFDAGGVLTGVEVGRAAVVVERNDDGLAVRLKETRSGRWVAFSWQGGHIASAGASDGRAVDYVYDEDQLKEVRRPAGDVTYRIEQGRLAGVVDADGVVVVVNTYDDAGRVATQTSPFGRTSLYRYEAGGLSVVTDAEDFARNGYVHDRRGNLTVMADGAGAAMTMTYNPAGRMTGCRDRRGATWRITWNEAGTRPLHRVGPLGFEERWEWDEEDRILAHHDPLGTTRWAYPGPGFSTPSRIVEPGGATSAIEVSEDDLPVAITDADGVRVTLAYDADGQTTAIRDGLGNTTRLGYDAAGHLATWRCPSSATTAYRNDPAGRVLSAVAPGGRWTYRWSPAGRGVGGDDAAEGTWSARLGSHGAADEISGALGQHVGLAYDACGNLNEITGPDGRVCRQGFDPMGRLESVSDPGGATWRYRYDREGALVSIQDPGGEIFGREVDLLGRTIAETDGAGRTWRRAWGDDGQLARVIDPTGETTAYRYDEAGRLVEVRQGEVAVAEWAWSGAGRLTGHRSVGGGWVSYRYDAAGRLAGMSDEEGSVSFVVDVDGRMLRAEDERGRVITLKRDEAGRVVSVTDRRGVVREIGIDAAGRVRREAAGASGTEFGYDSAGMMTSATDAVGATTRYGRDGAGRVTSVTDPLGATTRYGYDPAGRLGSVTDALGATTTLLRDAAGRMLGARHADGSGWRSFRDGAGLVTGFGAVDALEPEVALVRDPAGLPGGLPRVTGAGGGGRYREPEVPVDDAGRVSASPAGDLYRHDAAGQLVEWVPGGGASAEALRWAYDPGGRLVAETSGPGQTRYEHDALGRLARRVGPDGAVTTFRYDAAGRRAFQIGPAGRTTYRWDATGRLAEVDWGRGPVGISYDNLGLVSSVGGVGVDWDLSGARPRVARIGEVSYHRHEEGLSLTGPDGADVPVAADWMGTVGAVLDPWGASEEEGVRLGYRGELCFGGLLWLGARVYDPATRSFLSPDPLPNPPGAPCAANPYHYAWNDPVTYIDPEGLRPLTQAEFDARRHLEEEGHVGQAIQAAKKDPWGTLALGAVFVGGVALCLIPGTQVLGAGVLIGVGMSAAAGVATGNFNPRFAAFNGVVGGVTGGVGSAFSGTGVLTEAALGAATGAGANAATQEALTGHVQWGQVALSAGVGGVAGGLGARLGAARDVNSGDKCDLVPGGGLAAHEAAGGHTLALHVTQTDAELMARLASDTRIQAASTFASRTTAESELSRLLSNKQAEIQSWLAGTNQRLQLDDYGFGETGRVMLRGSTMSAPASQVRAVLFKAPNSALGYYIRTGFPRP